MTKWWLHLVAWVLLLARGLHVADAAGANPEPYAVHLYVSPSGDDSHDGRQPKDAFATIARARDEIRRVKSQGGLPKNGVAVEIAGGCYMLEHSLELTDADSGAPDAMIIYRAVEGECVHLTGCRNINVAKFSPVTDAAIVSRLDPAARENVRCLSLNAMGIAHAGPYPMVFSDNGGILELFFQGHRLPLSRWPKSGYETMQTVLSNGDAHTGGTFQYRGKRPLRWIHNPNLWLKGKWRVGWEDPAIRVASIDRAAHSITFAAGISNGIGSKYQRPQGSGKEPYYALNLIEEITGPGEWAIDFTSGILYLWPPSTSTDAQVAISQMDAPIIHVKGASNITLAGLTLEHSMGDGIAVDEGDRITIAGCTILNLAKRGIILNARRSTIQSCDVHDVGYGCIYVSGGDRKKLVASENLVTNNHLHHYGVLKNQYSAAIDTGFNGTVSVGATISHNLIHHAPRDAILVAGDDNTFEYNEVFSCGYDSADTGAFYSWSDWTIRNIVVRYNFVHDTIGGINPDDGASGFVVYGNVFVGPRVGWWIASGPDHRFEHNIIVKDQGPVFGIDDRGVSRGYATNKRMFAAVKSVEADSPPWSARFPTMVDMLQHRPELPWRVEVSHNVICIKSGDPFSIRMGKENRANPNLLKCVDNFVTADDPGFVDAPAGNYSLRPDSAVFKRMADFPAVPFNKVGLYLDHYRGKLPVRDPSDDPFKADTDRNFGT